MKKSRSNVVLAVVLALAMVLAQQVSFAVAETADDVQSQETTQVAEQDIQADDEAVADERDTAQTDQDEQDTNESSEQIADIDQAKQSKAVKTTEVAECDVYLDGVNGSDDNDGTSRQQAVKTFAKAKELLGDRANNILVTGTIAANGETFSLQDPSKQSVKRASGFGGVVFELSGANTFTDFRYEGNGATPASSVVVITSGTTTFAAGAAFNNQEVSTTTNGAIANVHSGGYAVFDGASFSGNIAKMGGVFYVANGGKALIKSGTFTNNVSTGSSSNGGGAFYLATASEALILGGTFTGNKANMGGVGYVAGSASLTVKAGHFENNQASRNGGVFCAYENKTPSIKIYNALMTDNTANIGGAIYNCSSASTQLCKIDGAAIFDNNGNFGKDMELTGESDVSEAMIGGGEHDWQHIDNNAQHWESNATDEEKEAAWAVARSVFVGNKASNWGGAVSTNGVLLMGTEQAALEIKKVDADDNEAVLEGAEFTLAGTTATGHDIEEVKTTGSDGIATFGYIIAGTYKLTETKAPEGYQLTDKEWTVTVNESEDGFNVVVMDADTVVEGVLEVANAKIPEIVEEPEQPNGPQDEAVVEGGDKPQKPLDKKVASATKKTVAKDQIKTAKTDDPAGKSLAMFIAMMMAMAMIAVVVRKRRED